MGGFINNETFFKYFIDNTPDLFWIISPDLKNIYYISPNIEKLYHFSREEIATPEDWLSKVVFYKDRQKVVEGIQAGYVKRSCYSIRLSHTIKEWFSSLGERFCISNKNRRKCNSCRWYYKRYYWH